MTAKQYILITGLGSSKIEACARAVLRIHTLFGSTLPTDTLVPCKPVHDSEYVCLGFSNRYFKGKDDDNWTVLEFGNDIDPYYILISRCNGGEHTEENAVLYFDRKIDLSTGYVQIFKPEPDELIFVDHLHILPINPLQSEWDSSSKFRLHFALFQLLRAGILC